MTTDKANLGHCMSYAFQQEKMLRKSVEMQGKFLDSRCAGDDSKNLKCYLDLNEQNESVFNFARTRKRLEVSEGFYTVREGC
ncbi:hypothetical protein TNCV_3140551 [Trichonephila clavipes]|nr:hypothetical protein TNCV_3140551 [Trichonephila clavipes]